MRVPDEAATGGAKRPARKRRRLGAVLAVGLAGGLLLVGLGHRLYPWLAVSAPVESGWLVIEGWVPDDVVRAGWERWQRGEAQTLLTPGIPLERGEPLAEYGDYGTLTAATLRAWGCPSNQVVAIPAPTSVTGRTFVEAMATRRWFERQGALPAAVNVLTAGPHARRTRLMFEQAFGEGVRIGIIAAPDTGYDPARWWRTSDGFRTVVGELIAYAHARVLFRPPPEASALSRATAENKPARP